MSNPLYRVDNEVNVKAPVLLHNFSGNLDAGRVNAIVTRHIFTGLKYKRIATFVTDEIMDMRAYRPVATVDNWCLTDIDIIDTTLDLFYDDKGVAFLVLSGIEPHHAWTRFSQAVLELIKPFGVERAFTMTGVSSNVPHTRKGNIEVMVTNPSNDIDKSQGFEKIKVLATCDIFLQNYLSKHLGVNGFTLVTHVPFYLAESDFPQGSYALVEKFSAMSGLGLPVGDLVVACEMANKMLESNTEIVANSGLITALEEQFDNGKHDSSNIGVGNLDSNFADPIPSGDELAESIEAFLKLQEGQRGEDKGSGSKRGGFFRKFFGGE